MSDFFFFQAEDGIRGDDVTGVQTCALPIYAQVFRGVCEWMGMELVDLVGGDGRVSPALDSVMGRVELWVDGLLGTGFRPPLGDVAVLLLGMVEKARASTGASVVALDCPSGMDVDTGALSDGGLRADVTLTFAATKAEIGRAHV